MVYGIYINGCIFYPVKHEITMSHEIDSAVFVLLQLRVDIICFPISFSAFSISSPFPSEISWRDLARS